MSLIGNALMMHTMKSVAGTASYTVHHTYCQRPGMAEERGALGRAKTGSRGALCFPKPCGCSFNKPPVIFRKLRELFVMLFLFILTFQKVQKGS